MRAYPKRAAEMRFDMKRVLSAVVIVVLIVPMLIFSQTKLLNMLVAAISVISLYEALIATKYVESKQLMAFSLLIAVIVPFLESSSYHMIVLLIFLFVFVMFLLTILNTKVFQLEHMSVAFMLSMMIPYFFSGIIEVRNATNGQYYIFLIFIASWFTDTGAYLIGKLFGKHKLCPEVSPKKTIEGAIGGIIGSVLGFTLFSLYVEHFVGLQVEYPLVILTAIAASIVAQVGDLSASVIKRSFGVKDFGNLIPGHGGMLDRFDSVLFVAPFLNIILQFAPLFI